MFASKSKNKWEARAQFVKQPKMYRLHELKYQKELSPLEVDLRRSTLCWSVDLIGGVFHTDRHTSHCLAYSHLLSCSWGVSVSLSQSSLSRYSVSHSMSGAMFHSMSCGIPVPPYHAVSLIYSHSLLLLEAAFRALSYEPSDSLAHSLPDSLRCLCRC